MGGEVRKEFRDSILYFYDFLTVFTMIEMIFMKILF